MQTISLLRFVLPRSAQVTLDALEVVSGRVVRDVASRYCSTSRSGLRNYGDIPADSASQLSMLRTLNEKGTSGREQVVQLFESGTVRMSEGTLCEYVKALATLDRLDGSRLAATLHQGARSASQRLPSFKGPFISPFTNSGTNKAVAAEVSASQLQGGPALGSSEKPLFIKPVDKSLWEHMWATLRACAVTFILIAGLAVLIDEKAGVTKSFLNNPDLKPQKNTNTTFDDVKGVDEVKEELQEVVEYLRRPEAFTQLGGKLPKGVLLVGPPGTGKTMLARAIAGEAGVPFFYASGSEFDEVYVGVGARRVRDLFATAKTHAPCIIFIDEIDAVGSSRNSKDQMYQKMTLNQMLVELDGFRPTEGVIVVAATNFPESLDKALVRPGRFDRHIIVPEPDWKGRLAILEAYFSKVKLGKDVDLEATARGTPGFSGAQLANLVNVAALKAARDKATKVSQADVEYAKDRIMMGAERKGAFITEENKKLTAYHEGGHALVAMLTRGAMPVHKATIMPRGQTLGMVMQLPDKDDKSMTRRQLNAMLDVCMGGRVAEELIFGGDDVTTGASQDLSSASGIARAMVTQYGFSDRVGPQKLSYEGSSLSPESRALVEDEVRGLVDKAYQRAKQLLMANEDKLHLLAKELVKEETLSGDQIARLLGIPMAQRG